MLQTVVFQNSAFMQVLSLLLGQVATASVLLAPPLPPACTNLTGDWCCLPTSLRQNGSRITTAASYGHGLGNVSGHSVSMYISNMPAGTLLTGTISPDCSTITYSTGNKWTRTGPYTPGPPPPPPPAPNPYNQKLVPAPEWVGQLSILEVNAKTYTTGDGYGKDGSGSGTWALLTDKVSYWHDLGVTGIWLAYFNVADDYFHNIKSVYGSVDPALLDPELGTELEFQAFVDACHAAGVRVFLDVIGLGVVPTSHYVTEHPEWFQRGRDITPCKTYYSCPCGGAPRVPGEQCAGRQYGLINYNYSSPAFLTWWHQTWTGYVIKFGVDGFRLDSEAEVGHMRPTWDKIAQAALDAGHPIAVWGEDERYHFSEHDFWFSSLTNMSHWVGFFRGQYKQVGTMASCFATACFSDHDNGGGNTLPANTFQLRGSRARFGFMGIFSPFIPLWLGGDEYNEDPVVFAPALKNRANDTLPGGWMYGTIKQWWQLDDPKSAQSLMRDDTRAMLAVRAAHADLFHHNLCTAAIANLDVLSAPTDAWLELAPYARWVVGKKAALVIANTQTRAINVTVSVDLRAMGLAGRGHYRIQTLYGGGMTASNTSNASATSTILAEVALKNLQLEVPGDLLSKGGLRVVLIVPVAIDTSASGEGVDR